jgi:hypothetical protein
VSTPPGDKEHTMGTTSDEEPGPDPHERARESVEHLRAAAHELIEAARAALDVAEQWVDDPDAAASLAGTLASVGAVARRVAGTGGWLPTPGAPGAGTEASPQDGLGPEAEPRVQRIPVS